MSDGDNVGEKKVKVQGKECWRDATLGSRESPSQTLFFITSLESVEKEH